MLVCESVCKSFAGKVALDNLSLSIDAGEVVCLLGANGAGKTTTINLFLGFLPPDSGTVRVAGLDPVTDAAAARSRLAYIPESVALYPELSGIENLAFFDALIGRRRSHREYGELLGELGLDTAAAGRSVATYSKGMRQKVGLAIALVREASALLMDEPLSGLDPQAANEFGERVRTLRGAGSAVLMATHDIFRAKEVADRIGIMRSGRLLEMLDADSLDAHGVEAIYLRHMHDLAGEAAA